MECQNCRTLLPDRSRFCSNCGTPFSSTASASQSPPASGSFVLPVAREELFRRAIAYVLDLAPVLVLATLHFIPFLGWITFGALTSAWWLLRDINGASLGKSILGSMVLSESGHPCTTNQLILRNVTLAIPGILHMIPLLGILIGPIAALIIWPIEILVLLITGRRIGDRLAGTDVFRKSAPSPAPYPPY